LTFDLSASVIENHQCSERFSNEENVFGITWRERCEIKGQGAAGVSNAPCGAAAQPPWWRGLGLLL
jgi:hypothetical protein